MDQKQDRRYPRWRALSADDFGIRNDVSGDYFDMEELERRPKKKKRLVRVKPFLLRGQDPMCDTMFTVQREFSAVSVNVKRCLLTFVRRKTNKVCRFFLCVKNHLKDTGNGLIYEVVSVQ